MRRGCEPVLVQIGWPIICKSVHMTSGMRTMETCWLRSIWDTLWPTYWVCLRPKGGKNRKEAEANKKERYLWLTGTQRLKPCLSSLVSRPLQFLYATCEHFYHKIWVQLPWANVVISTILKSFWNLSSSISISEFHRFHFIKASWYVGSKCY